MKLLRFVTYRPRLLLKKYTTTKTETAKEIYINEFSNINDYKTHFFNLSNIYKRELLKSLTQVLPLKTFRMSRKTENGRFYAYLTLENSDHIIQAENEGLYSMIYHKKEGKIAHISKLVSDEFSLNSNEYCVELLTTGNNLPDISAEDIRVVYKPNLTSVYRMVDSLRFIVDQENFLLSPKILPKLIAESKQPITDEDLKKLDHLTSLNESQKRAIISTLKNTVTLIQGPPGTGKTKTCAEVVNQWCKTLSPSKKILVCASSNKAVDNIAELLEKIDVKTVRVYAKAQSLQDYPFLESSLHYKIEKKLLKDDDGLSTIHNSIFKQEFTTLTSFNNYFDRIFPYELEVLSEAQVICCTCISAGSQLIRHFEYECVLVDEAAQPTEPETVIAASLAQNKLVLVGDHKQLGPVIMESLSINNPLSLTLFERLENIGMKLYLLDTQYRMHPAIAEFPNICFYDSKLKNGIIEKDREFPTSTFKWPNPQVPMFFYSVEGVEESPIDSMSHFNMIEGEKTLKVFSSMLDAGIPSSSIGIISPYAAQRNLIQDLIKTQFGATSPQYLESSVFSVYAFQGREKDYIIISCVRSNDEQSIGFLDDPKQLNVAITRAKYGLIIIGNPFILKSSPIWKTYLNYFKEHNLLYKGEYPNMISLDSFE